VAAVDYRAVAVRAAQRAGINPAIFLRQINQESGFNPNARSSAGAVGIAQIVPRWHPGVDATDPIASLAYAAHYMAGLVHKYGNYQSALSVYNSGNPNAWKDPGFANGQTYHYVRSILGGSNPAVTGTTPPLTPPAPPLTLRPPGGGFSPALLGLLNQTNRMLGLPALTLPPSSLAPSAIPATPLPAAGMLPPSNRAGGFIPRNALFTAGRHDEGRDFTTNPGGAIIAPGDGYVLSVRSDPHGFGPSYPIVHFTSGPYKGRNIYLGHTLSVVRPGDRFRRGQTLSHTGTSGVGNATVPGWAEIGYAPGGLPGVFGQPAPF